MEKKKELNLTQEQKDQVFKEEMNKKKQKFAKNLLEMVSDGGVGLYIVLSSMLFGVFIPMYMVGMNPYLFEKAFGMAPVVVTGLTTISGITMFLGWLLFGSITVELYKRRKKNKNKKKRWWEI